MKRELTAHRATPLNEVLRIIVNDEPGAGGANHSYSIEPTVGNAKGILIEFQKGGLQETGGVPNGASIEALLAIVLDRLEGFQKGDFRCRENALAFTHIENGLMYLKKRTQDRIARGVEGTSQK